MRGIIQSAAILSAFISGVLVAPVILKAHADTAVGTPATLTPQVIDLSAMTDADIGPLVPHIGTLRTRFLVKTPQATIAIQSGDVPKHLHLESNEIQYVIAGTGSFWLGDKQVMIHPGDLIIIPKDTPHAGNVSTSSEFKVLAIKIPPQNPGDMHMAN